MGSRRISTGIRFDPDVHEALRETADAMGIGMNWLVNQLCKEGLVRLDLDNFTLVRPAS